jgi:hypothetical protein
MTAEASALENINGLLMIRAFEQHRTLTEGAGPLSMPAEADESHTALKGRTDRAVP